MKHFDFDHDGKDWFLKEHGKDRAKKIFRDKTKEESIREMKDHLGGPSSVRIKKMDHTIQEERTYPRSADPTKSPG